MEELLGIDSEAFTGIAADSSDEETVVNASPTKSIKPTPNTSQKSSTMRSDEERLATYNLTADAFATPANGNESQTCAASSAVSVAVTPFGLGLFAVRDFAQGEVIFSERPQIAVVSSSSKALHCDSCLRTMMVCPAGLPHPELWPETPRQTSCIRCAMTFCCRTCQLNANALGHSRFCDAVHTVVPDAAPESRLATFDGCCRELMAMSPNPGQLASCAHLALRMMAQMLKVAEAGSETGSAADNESAQAAQQQALDLYAHLTTTTYTTGSNGNWCESAALRLYPLAQRTLLMSDEESAWLTAGVMRELLRCVSLNSIWIEPVSSFADYVRASVSPRLSLDGSNSQLADSCLTCLVANFLPRSVGSDGATEAPCSKLSRVMARRCGLRTPGWSNLASALTRRSTRSMASAAADSVCGDQPPVCAPLACFSLLAAYLIPCPSITHAWQTSNSAQEMHAFRK